YGSQLSQVWTNIISNAIDAMSGSGKLTVRVSSGGDDTEIVEICDTGPGIPPEIRDKIFDPFFTTKPPGSGTGQGLNIVHDTVVQRHRGRLDVTSEPGNTCFRIE